MHTTPSIIPLDDAERLAAVRRYGILDTPSDGAFDRVVQLAARLFKVPIAIVSIVDEDRIWFKARHGLDVEQIGRDPGLCASAILQDEPLVVVDALLDPSTLANPLVAGEFGLRFYAGAPLTTSDGHKLGTICVIDKEPRVIGPDDVATLAQLAEIVVHELELRLATQAVVDLEREQRALEAARHGLEASERERTRWARELHDETLQSLGALRILLVSGLENSAELHATVTEAADFVHDEIVKLRHLIAELRPAVLDEVGLVAALESLAHKHQVIDGLEVELQVDPPAGWQMSRDAESTIYRAVQEALANVSKHAAARHAVVNVRRSDQGVDATVRDDGAGFDVDSLTDGLGLIGMRERAMLAGGDLVIRSAPGAGTSLRFTLPINGSAPGEVSGIQQPESPRELGQLQ